MAAGAVNAASFNSALKEWYTPKQVQNVVYKNNPWLAMCPKNESVTGKYLVQPVQYGNAQGRSANFATAQANKSTNNYIDYNIPMVDNFGVLSITRKVMKQSANDRGAFFKARVRETDGMLQTLSNSCAVDMYRNSGGARGQIASGETTATITLQDIEEITNFEQDMVLQASTTDGTSGAVKAGTVTVTAVDRDAGTVTCAPTWDDAGNIPTIAAGDYLFQEGDFGAMMQGLGGWIPDTAPTAGDSFFGVDRSSDPTRLAGTRIDASGGIPLAEAWQNGTSRLGREGQYPDMGLCSHAKYNDLVQELGNKVVYDEFGSKDVDYGFKGIKIIGTKSDITIYPDHNCPDARMYLLTKDTWELISYGPVPDMVDDDGVTMLREVSSAAYEIRADYYANMSCRNPSANAVIKLS